MLLALTASVASAAGLQIHWNACGGAGVQDQAFACDADDAFFQAVAQFQMPVALSGVTGVEFTVDLASASPTLPPWWQFNAGECRDSQLAVTEGTPSAVACPDWAGNNASGGLAAYNEGAFGPNTAHILGGFAVAAAKARSLTTTPNYFVFNIIMSSANTVVGPPICPGCQVPVCIVFNGLKVVPGTAQPTVISNAAAPGSNFVTWQGGQGTGTILGTVCPQATPTHKSTWGAVKSLYR
jgi:hypothetical protein